MLPAPGFRESKRPEFFPLKTRNGKNIKIGVDLKERRFLAFNTGVNLGGMFRHIILVFLTKLCLYIKPSMFFTFSINTSKLTNCKLDRILETKKYFRYSFLGYFQSFGSSRFGLMDQLDLDSI